MSLEALKYLQESLADLKNENDNRRYAITELYTKDEDEEDIERESEIIAENEMRIAYLQFGINCMAVGLFIHDKLSLSEAAELCNLSLHDFRGFLHEKGIGCVDELDKEKEKNAKMYNLQDVRLLALEHKILPQQRILEVFRENLSLSEFIAWDAPELSIEICRAFHDFILKKLDEHADKNHIGND